MTERKFFFVDLSMCERQRITNKMNIKPSGFIWPQSYKTFFMLNSAEHDFFFLLINLKLLTTANYFLLYIAEHENVSANKYQLLLVFSYLLADKNSCSVE